MELSRRPRHYVKDGVRCYCSRACGGDCRASAYKMAVANGARLAKSLGKGWVSIVHENLGWHYRAVHKATGASMHEHGLKYYWVQVMVGRIQFHTIGPTLKHALSSLRGMLTGARLSIENAEKALWN